MEIMHIQHINMELEDLIEKYEINNSSPTKFHEDLSVYYDFFKTPVLSLETERQMLNIREVKMCQDYGINYYTFRKNLGYLEEYHQLSGERN